MSDILVEVARGGAVEIVTINRPDALNSLSMPLTAELESYFRRLAKRPEVRVVILAAAGRAFCAGVDLKGWKKPEEKSASYHYLATQTSIGDIYRAMRACPQPIIACAAGAACGGGFSLLLASDIRIAAPNLRMNAAYIRIGLGGCDMASSYLLPRLVGKALASELLLTGRFIDAERSLRLGLVNDIVSEEGLMDAALAYADDMLATSPLGLRLTKQALDLNVDAPSMDAAMALEDRQQVLLAGTADAREAVDAFVAKRAPDFVGN